MIIEQIGKETQTSVYIVERQHQKFLLKKVECFDESEANKAFKEADPLRDLQHVYVSGYIEHFVLWEKQNSSVYICILMEYFQNGTLENILKKCRDKKEVIAEETIKQWLGQLMEAFVYVHKKNIIHRDVRPGNIFIQTDDTLALGDFRVATVMEDAMTCTRAKPESMNYIAPEVATKGFCEKSDIWSLGCILFEMVTTWMYDSQQAVKKIKEIIEHPETLEEVSEEIAKHYSSSLVSVLKKMFQVNSFHRPSTSALLSEPFIQQCVEMSDSTQLEKRKRLKSASSSKSDMKVPKDKGILKVLEFLAKMIDYENCVNDALAYLLELAKSDEGLHIDPRGKKLISMAMKNNMTNSEIQVNGSNVLSSLVVYAESNDVLFTPEVLSVIPLAMEHHKNNGHVQYAAATLLMNLAEYEMAGTVVGQLGGVQDILVALRTHPDNVKLCSICLNAFWGLSVYGNNIKIATEERGIKEISHILKLHMKSVEVSEAACASILALSLDEENLDLIGELNVIGLLIASIHTHAKNCKVVKNACLAIASLVEIDEESGYRVLSNEGPHNTRIAGVPIIINAYQLHKDNAEVVESIVTVLMELAANDDVCAEMDHFNVGPGLLSEIFKRFKENVDITRPCEKALALLEAVKHPTVPAIPSSSLQKVPMLQQMAKVA